MKSAARKLGIAGVGVTAGIAVGFLITNGANADTKAPHYAKNANGMTYGRNIDATSPKDLPDLIKAQATNGKQGYVRRTDYEDPTPKTPQEALAWGQSHKGTTRTIPVYAEDGMTKIGEFIIKY